jgi:all-trans-retinol 13,14-reductase
VLEKHYTAGGFTHVFKRKDYEWDVGIHYIGETQRESSIVRKLFDYVTDGNLKWADIGEVYDCIVIGDQKYDFLKGVSNFKKQLISYFPEEEKAINSYVDLVFEAVKTSKNYHIIKVLSLLLEKNMNFGEYLQNKIVIRDLDSFNDEVAQEFIY